MDIVRDALEQAIDKLDWRSLEKDPLVFSYRMGDSSSSYNVADHSAFESDTHEMIRDSAG